MTSDARRGGRALGAALLVLAAVPAYFAFTLSWAPETAFDIIGVLQLAHNLPRLFAVALTVGLVLGGIGLLIFGPNRPRAARRSRNRQ